MLVYRKKHNDSINYYDYYLKDESQELKIIFGGNGDLYFCSKSFVECQEAEFYITKENMIIYNLFSELFKAFQNVEIYTINDFDLQYYDDEEELQQKYDRYKEWNEELKNSSIYKRLFNNNSITWISDDSISFNYETADTLKIIKEENQFKLEFTYYDCENELPYVKSIRIRNSGSRYQPFNFLMMNFFNKLQEYDPNNHQMHIEEYLYLKNNSKKLVKKL